MTTKIKIKEPEQLLALPAGKNWAVWWNLLRPHTLTAAFVPVAIGTVLALPLKPVKLNLFFAMLLACMLIQVATNAFNEYYDFVRGLDNEQSVGIGGAIVREGVAPHLVLTLASGFIVAALFLGFYLASATSWWLLPIGAVCIMAGYLYSGGPRPIAATPFGEVVAGTFMGLVIILLSFYIQTGSVTLSSVLVSIPVSFLIGAILMANNIRDLEGDRKNGRRTLAILLGHKRAVVCLTVIFSIAYVWLLGLVFSGVLPWGALLAFGSLPKAIQAVKGFRGKTTPRQMMPAMKATAQTNTLFGLLLALVLLFQYN
ncbi:mena: 1 4-dihydroxy-2-naphthoate octaprenyltransferase [Lucifera butyrica]|uniref:1,4-dihydroxy-2-naphthoate octaprenyltransferase n=1 Tax=Lucifera butyrica TaxID=1351585 RepID=A0A498R8G6_9FIRM|nr:1,4-dihydroxy-2-naphthoate polyprenyltransferase [Lucifera butyrica]VBB06572.1 mena: 1 4-dihydroxy-2-naphthoate octaprenyltransferase [Lucifera butyrica]